MTTLHEHRSELIIKLTNLTSALLRMEGFGHAFTASLNEVLFHHSEAYAEVFAQRLPHWAELDRVGVSLEGNVYRNAAEWYIANDQLPPPWVKDWLLNLVQKTRDSDKQLGRPRKNYARDLAVFFAVVRTCGLGHVRPTRNDATSEPSGCGIVAQALTEIGYPLSEKSVARIWNKFAKGRANKFWELVSMPDDD